jgi:hypothetical protein
MQENINSLNSKRKEIIKMKKFLAVIAAISIIFTLAACNSNVVPKEDATATDAADSITEAPKEPVTLEDGISSFGNKNDYTNAFYLEIINKAGTESKYGVYTKEATLGDALSKMGIIAGEEGPYGLMIESVLGEEHIYETTGYVWMVYVNGEQAQTGVDGIKLENGATYSLKVETF